VVAGSPPRALTQTRFHFSMPKVEIQSVENGPNLVLVDGKPQVALCRCGQSSSKPLCDGTHHEVGFEAPAARTKILD
jgi:CDGSH-type Zn-finger protein